MKKLGFTLFGLLGLMLATGLSARADSISFYLTTQECHAPCTPTIIPTADAVEVVVTTTTGSVGDWTGATVEFFAPTATSIYGALGHINAPVALNGSGAFEASGTDPLAPTNPCEVGDPALITATLHACAAANSSDALGTENVETGAGTPATITVTLTAELTNFWTSAAAVLTPAPGVGSQYAQGFEAFDGGSGTQYAGFYASSSVPEPTSVILLGSVALLVGSGLRRKLARK